MEIVLPKDAEDIVKKSKYKNCLEKVIKFTYSLLDKHNLKPTAVQQKVLINHLSEMVDRAKENRELESVDPSIFNQVSNESMQIAQDIVNFVEKVAGKLAASEKYVLSIHFEAMKMK